MIRMRVFLWVLVALVVGVLGLFAYQLRQPKNDWGIPRRSQRLCLSESSPPVPILGM